MVRSRAAWRAPEKTMTKIDLDEIDRTAQAVMNAVTASIKDRLTRPAQSDPEADITTLVPIADGLKAYARVMRPDIAVALVERIRRLEGLLGDVADALSSAGTWSNTVAQIRELLEKGAVLP
jgi:hypothetical protein